MWPHGPKNVDPDDDIPLFEGLEELFNEFKGQQVSSKADRLISGSPYATQGGGLSANAVSLAANSRLSFNAHQAAPRQIHNAPSTTSTPTSTKMPRDTISSSYKDTNVIEPSRKAEIRSNASAPEPLSGQESAMAAPPSKPTLQPLVSSQALVVPCADDIATKVIPNLVVLGVTDPNRTVEQAVLNKTFDVKYKLGIKYNERERLGPEWKPADGEWKKWVTTEFRLAKMYAGDSFGDVITTDLAREFKTNLDVMAFRATEPVKSNFDDTEDSGEPLIYEYKLPKSFKVRIEINPHNPMIPPLNLHKSNTWGLKTRELVKDGVNGANHRHIRLLAQADFCMQDKVAELPIETYLADLRPLPRNISNDDLIKMKKDRLTKAIRDTRHPTPYKLAVTIDWPSWCKTKAGPKPSPSIEDGPITIPEDDFTSYATTSASKTASKKGPKTTAAIEDDPQHTKPAPVRAKKEASGEPSQPARAQESTKMPPPPIKRHSTTVYGHSPPKLRFAPASPFTDLPAPAAHEHPSPQLGAIKEETNTRRCHNTPTAKPLKKGKGATSSAAKPSTPAAPNTPVEPSSVPSSDMDKPGAVKIIWGAKDQNGKVTNLGTSKRNCRACGAKMRDFVALLDHLKSAQTHLDKEIKLQYWGNGQTVNVWLFDLPAEYGGTKLFVEDGREKKWKWLEDEARMASSTTLAPGSGLAPRSSPLAPPGSSPALRAPSPVPPVLPPASPSSELQAAKSKEEKTARRLVPASVPPQAKEMTASPSVVVEDDEEMTFVVAEEPVDQTPVSLNYLRLASEATVRTVKGTQKDLILHDDVTRLPLRPGDNIVSYQHDRDAQIRQTHIDAIWARQDLSENEKDLWVAWDLYMLANPNMSRGAYKSQMPVMIKKFVCANWAWFHQRKSRTLAWMKKLGMLELDGVITPEMATNGVRLLVPPIIPEDAWYRVDRERKWDNERLEDNRRNWTALWNALVFLGERWGELPPVMEIMVDQFIHVAGHLFLMLDHAADLKLSILDKLFSITTKTGEVIMSGKGHLEDELGRKIKWGDLLASNVINLCHEEAMKIECLDHEFRRYYATREKYFASHADETLEAKMKGLFRHHATDFRLWQWRRAHEVELHLSFMNGEIDVGLLCSVLPNLRMVGGGQIGGPDAPPPAKHPLVVVAPLMKPKPLLVEPPPTGKRIPNQKPYVERGFMECKCGTDVYESNTVRCCNARSKDPSRRCFSPYYHRECTEEFRKDGSDGLFRPKNWYCEECEKKGWGDEINLETKKKKGVEEVEKKQTEMKGLGSEGVHSDCAQLPARKKQKTTEENSGWEKRPEGVRARKCLRS